MARRNFTPKSLLCNCQDRNGALFAMARTLDGIVNATFTVELRDGIDAPAAYFSACDPRAETDGPDGAVMACASGTAADRNADIADRSVCVAPLCAGG